MALLVPRRQRSIERRIMKEKVKAHVEIGAERLDREVIVPVVDNTNAVSDSFRTRQRQLNAMANHT